MIFNPFKPQNTLEAEMFDKNIKMNESSFYNIVVVSQGFSAFYS